MRQPDIDDQFEAIVNPATVKPSLWAIATVFLSGAAAAMTAVAMMGFFLMHTIGIMHKAEMTVSHPGFADSSALVFCVMVLVRFFRYHSSVVE